MDCVSARMTRMAGGFSAGVGLEGRWPILTLLLTTFCYLLLWTLKTVLVNDCGDGPASCFFATTDHAPETFDHDILGGAEDVSGHRDSESDGGTDCHVRVRIEEHAACAD